MKSTNESKQLKVKSVAQLAKELMITREKLIELRRNLTLEKLKKTSDIGKTKKYIAQINTIIREKLAKEVIKEK